MILLNYKNKDRIIYIDVLKGIGILLVVLGHMYNSKLIYCFHMPLFFLLYGFLFKFKERKFQIVSSTRRFMLPYFSFFLILSIPEILLGWGPKDDIYGLNYGGGETYWFIDYYVGLSLWGIG